MCRRGDTRRRRDRPSRRRVREGGRSWRRQRRGRRYRTIALIGIILGSSDPLAAALSAGRPSLHQGAVFTGLEATLQGLAHARRPRRSTLARCHRRLARSGRRCRRRCRRCCRRGTFILRLATFNGFLFFVSHVRCLSCFYLGLSTLLVMMMMVWLMTISATYTDRPRFGGRPGVEARALAATGRHRPRRKRSRGGGISWPAVACESHGFGERWRARDRSSTACRLRLPSDD